MPAKSSLKKNILLVALILLAVGMAFVLMNLKSGKADEKLCQADSDCKPANCHTKTCVNKNFAPDVMCTMVCMPNTLDCGQGECKCVAHQCEAVFK